MNPEKGLRTVRRKNARRASMIAVGSITLGLTIGWTCARSMPLPLPEMGAEVVVTTARGHHHVAYMDLDRQWKNRDTGEVITNVTQWERP